MPIQTEWALQNWPITKNGVLAATALFFQKNIFSLRALCKELIWWTKHTSVHIHNFRKPWIFIWECFFPVSIVNVKLIFRNQLSKNYCFLSKFASKSCTTEHRKVTGLDETHTSHKFLRTKQINMFWGKSG